MTTNVKVKRTRNTIPTQHLRRTGFTRRSQADMHLDSVDAGMDDSHLKLTERLAIGLSNKIPPLWREDCQQDIRVALWGLYLDNPDDETLIRKMSSKAHDVSVEWYRMIDTERGHKAISVVEGTVTTDVTDLGRGIPIPDVADAAIANIYLDRVPKHIIRILERSVDLVTLRMSWGDCTVEEQETYRAWKYQECPLIKGDDWPLFNGV